MTRLRIARRSLMLLATTLLLTTTGVTTHLVAGHGGGHSGHGGGGSTGGGNLNFTYVAIHPQASTQSTALGKTLLTLQAWNGLIYPGYGDYDANTGPISITPFDPATNTFASTPELDGDLTEAIYGYRPLGGRLFAPSTDPRGGYSTDYAVASPTTPATWTQVQSVGMIHAFDMASSNGSDLFLVGAQGANTAVAYRSTDGGATWSLSLSVPPASTVTDDFARFYFAASYNGKVYVQASDYYGGAHPKSKVFDGTSWTDGPNLLSNGGLGFHPQTFAGKLVYQGWGNAYPSPSYLSGFDGKSVRAVSSVGFYDYAIDGTRLVGLDGSGGVWSTTDLVTWTKLGSGPNTARSITSLNGHIYLGTTDSKIYVAAG